MCKCLFCTNPTHEWVIIYNNVFEGEYKEALAKINMIDIGMSNSIDKEIAHDISRAILKQEMILVDNKEEDAIARELISKLQSIVSSQSHE